MQPEAQALRVQLRLGALRQPQRLAEPRQPPDGLELIPKPRRQADARLLVPQEVESIWPGVLAAESQSRAQGEVGERSCAARAVELPSGE